MKVALALEGLSRLQLSGMPHVWLEPRFLGIGEIWQEVATKFNSFMLIDTFRHCPQSGLEPRFLGIGGSHDNEYIKALSSGSMILLKIT